jgi:prophage tail gpP-like protein
VRLYLSNPLVAGGSRTLKVTGIITQREAVSDAQGTVIRITGADLGWHLVHNDAPLWFNLRGTTLERLATACIFPHKIWSGERDPNWGFQGIRAENIQNRRLKQRLPFTPAEQLNFTLAAMNGQIVYVQVQPGQKIADLLIQYARRFGFLVGVSADGYLQFWLPKDQLDNAQYSIAYYPSDDLGSATNNVQAAQRLDSIDGLYTDLTAVGERPFPVDVGAIKNVLPNFGKYRGRFRDSTLLPFLRRAVFSDGDITEATKDARAEWRWMRGRFEAQTLTYRVRGHHQHGIWWESDTMCEVHDRVLGIEGDCYVSAVECRRDMQAGDVTTVTLKPPGLLTEIAIR